MTESPEEFSRREVDRSFRKFRDIVRDLMSAKFQTWGDTFSRLMTHCESDAVMRVVTEPLKSNPTVDADTWWNDAVNSVRGMVGSGQYSLPADDDERTALLYQVFLKIENEAINISNFCMAVYGHTKFQDMVNSFNHELVKNFTREVSYRLDEVAEDTKDQRTISRAAMVVFHHHDNSTTTNISGDVQGSIIATGNAQVSGSTAQFNTPTDVAAELRALKSIATEFSKTNQATISQALEFLATAAETGKAELPEIVENAQTVAEISPTIGSRLKGLLAGAGTSVIGSAIMEGLKLYFGG